MTRVIEAYLKGNFVMGNSCKSIRCYVSWITSCTHEGHRPLMAGITWVLLGWVAMQPKYSVVKPNRPTISQ